MWRQERLIVIMVCQIMTVTVHCPVDVFLEPMRMAVGFNHLQMILDRFKYSRRMCEGRHHGPKDLHFDDRDDSHLDEEE